MGIESEAKHIVRSKWFYLFVGILLGGTVLGGTVALVLGRARGLFHRFRGVADGAVATAQGK